jgi:hypothetical protein
MSILIRTERSVVQYNRSYKGIVSTNNIDEIPLEILLTIVTAKSDDPLLYDGYILSATQLTALNQHLNNKIIPDLVNCHYVLECSGIYDYDKS